MAAINRNNVMAGLFLLGSIALGLGVSFALGGGGSSFGPSMPVTVRFSISDGATGLKPGSAVMLGGQEVGSVRSVRIVTREQIAGEDQAGAKKDASVPGAVDVKVIIRSDLTLYENADFMLTLPLLGNISSINITSPGDPGTVEMAAGASAALEPNEVVRGKIAPPPFLTQAGFGAQQAEQVKRAITGLENGVNKMSGLLDTITPQLESSFSETREIVREIRANIDRWTGELSAVLTNMEAASVKIGPVVDNTGGLVMDLRGALSDNRDSVDAIIASLRSATSKIDAQTVDLVNDSLREGQRALSSLTPAVHRLSTLIGSEGPGLRRVLANLRLMSDQLKLTAIEVRSQPWRLLIQPTTKEFESQILYDAARTYAEAASNLRAASESLESTLAAGTGPDREAIEEISRHLADSVDQYRLAERALLDRLIEKQKK